MPAPSPEFDNRSGLTDLIPEIEAALEKACEFGLGCPSRLADAIRYALLAPGKRLRPAMVLMASDACGGGLADAMPGAVAVEMIHAYSLIHDDLPAMDDDDLRRGRPTVHVKFDEATAILAGDALQAEAFLQLANSGCEPAKISKVVAVLALAAGPRQLVGGQTDDLAAELRPQNDLTTRTLEHLESIHRRKTGALFSAALDIGAILAGANQASRDSLANYASDIGLAFQVVDDLLDFTSDAVSLGKRAGKDSRRGKLTYPVLMGLEASKDKAQRLIESAKRHLLFFGDSAWRLDKLADFVLERTH